MFFGIICTIYLLLYASSTFIITDQLYYRSLSNKLTNPSIATLLNIKNQYWWVGYVITPLVVLLKVFFATILISIGAVLTTIDFKFKTVFKAALIAEIVFIFAQILYLINLSFNLDALTLATMSNYYPLTVLSLYGTQNVVDWLQYPLKTLNLFEVFYMVAIAWLLAKHWGEDFLECLALVVPSYVTGLLLWLVLVTFLTLQVS